MAQSHHHQTLCVCPNICLHLYIWYTNQQQANIEMSIMLCSPPKNKHKLKTAWILGLRACTRASGQLSGGFGALERVLKVSFDMSFSHYHQKPRVVSTPQTARTHDLFDVAFSCRAETHPPNELRIGLPHVELRSGNHPAASTLHTHKQHMCRCHRSRRKKTHNLNHNIDTLLRRTTYTNKKSTQRKKVASTMSSISLGMVCSHVTETLLKLCYCSVFASSMTSTLQRTTFLWCFVIEMLLQ